MEQKTLFDLEPKSKLQIEEEIKENKRLKDLEITNFGINEETPYATIVNFECDDEKGWELQTFKKILGLGKVFNKKTKIDKFVVLENYFYKGLEEKLNGFQSDVEFKDKNKALEFLYGELEFMKFLEERNKDNVFWDTRRYMWKYSDKKFTRTT